MKKFFIIAGYVCLSVLILLYLAFLFVLPRKIDLNVYKPDIQKSVKENTDLSVDFGKIDVITSLFLEAGIKTKDISVKLPDGSTLFTAESFKGKVFLPSLLWLSVRVTCAEIESPNLNVEIINSGKYKVAKVYEDLVNRKRAQQRAGEIITSNQDTLPFDPASIKLYVPALKLNNYKAVVDDIKAAHKLTLQGNQIKVGYFNGKTAKLKVDAEILSDEDKNVTANIDIDSYIPEFIPAEKDEDEDAVFELPFVNPITAYRDYNLKTDISSKIKIRKSKKDGKLWAKGKVNIEDTTVTLSGLELPKSYFRLNAKGSLFDIDSNIYATEKEYLSILGTISNSNNPYVDLSLKSSQVHFANLLNIARAYLDTIHIKNDFSNMSANGYLLANFRVKTDFENLESDGKFIIRDGNIFDNNINLLFKDINANILLDNNILQVKDTHVLINDRPLKVSGNIGSDSVTNVNIYADKIPLPGLYKAFAPREIKNSYNLNSGDLTVNVDFKGEIKDTAALLKADLENLNLTDSQGNFLLTNKLARFGFAGYSGVIRGKYTNKDFKFVIPKTGSEISDSLLTINMNNSDAIINESNIKLNKSSIVKLSGKIEDYLSNPSVKIFASGALSDEDIKILAGEALAPYLESKGAIPLKASFESKKDKARFIFQMLAKTDSFISPVKIDDIEGKSLLMQLIAEKKGDSIKIFKSGLYLKRPDVEFKDNLPSNSIRCKEIVGIRAMISNLNTQPFLNLFKITVPKELNGSIYAFKNSRFAFNGNLNAYGELSNPRINGRFNIKNLHVPQWLTRIRNIGIDINNQNIQIDVRNVDANGSDFHAMIRSTLTQLSQMKLANVDIHSRQIDVDKLMIVSDGIIASLPTPATSSNSAVSETSDIPVEILGGSINLRKIKTGNIIVKDTMGRISLLKNILYIKNLKASPLDGNVFGEISIDLIPLEIVAKLSGKDFDVEKVLLDVMDMKDTLSGDMNFIADISFRGATIEEQMQTMKGYVDFNIKDGQLGPFGKFENFLMADNIRENAFFSSTIGSIITNIVTFDTSRYNSLFGHLTFEDGFAKVSPIKSQGNVMSLYIKGDVGLLDNSADLILRGKLGSAFSDKLGPLANINPVNLIKNTPGLNVVLAKTFSIFCEAVSEEEMNALPPLGEGKSDDYATKFQIKLRGDTRKPLKMIKSFKWLALDSDIESAKDFVDTIPIPEPGEEGLSVEELIKLREEQATMQAEQKQSESKKSVLEKIKDKFNKDSKEEIE